MTTEMVGCIVDLSLIQSPDRMTRKVAPSHIMAAKAEFTCEAAQRVGVEHGQAPQSIGILVA
jgi:hypothetical protein